MKTKHVFLIMALAIAFMLPTSGQNSYSYNSSPGEKKHSKPVTMAKPTFETTTEGLHIKAWVMTQQEHKEMMEYNQKEGTKGSGGMNNKGMGMNSASKTSMMSGTHHLKLEIEDPVTSKEIDNATASVTLISPSKKNSSVELMSMSDHLGGNLTLNEKGEYQFTVKVNADGKENLSHFNYTVK